MKFSTEILFDLENCEKKFNRKKIIIILKSVFFANMNVRCKIIGY